MNNRKNTRLSVTRKAKLQLADGSILCGTTKNLSFSGAYVNIADKITVNPGDSCSFILILCDEPNLIEIIFKCDIVRVESEGIALQFRYIDIGDYQHFKNLMINACPEPKQLLEELNAAPGLDVVTKRE
ncbi:MAG: PilZ domain-containing protein [Candidatus Marinimicrobia bacterium]|nr:PilZ domain-containing protein [Candidatus Neomarinimicrobiota bacterium]